MERKDLLQKWEELYEIPFEGWDFSEFQENLKEESIKWNYRQIVEEYLEDYIPKVEYLLDMGTGGGEFLASLKNLPFHTYATESYPPNIPIAKSRLEPLGIKVIPLQNDSNLPLNTHQFDLVINRHESYDLSELKRILKPKGIFITQQVGGNDQTDINVALGAPVNTEYNHWNLNYARKQLEDQGFSIILQKEDVSMNQFLTIEILIRYLRAIPWQIPDFSVKKYYSQIVQLSNLIKTQGEFQSRSFRFLMIAQNNPN